MLDAKHGAEAMDISQDYQGEIDLLLTDIVMPGINGRTLADQLIQLRPKIGVIFMSGYTGQAVGARGINAVSLLIAYCAGMAAASVPIVPGGLGVVDGALILGLVAGGLPSSYAVAAVVLYRLVSFGFIIGLGWLFWLAIRAKYGRPNPAAD